MGLLNALPIAALISGIVAFGALMILLQLCWRKSDGQLVDVIGGIMITAFVVLIAISFIDLGATVQKRVSDNTPQVHDTSIPIEEQGE